MKYKMEHKKKMRQMIFIHSVLIHEEENTFKLSMMTETSGKALLLPKV